MTRPGLGVHAGGRVAAGGIDLGTEAHVALGRQAETLHRIERHLRDGAPRYPGFHGAAVCPTPTATFLISAFPAGPAAGRLWHVVAWRVSGSSGIMNNNVAGTAAIFVGNGPGYATQGDVGENWRDLTRTQLPVPAYYQKGQLVVRYPESIYALINGGTAGVSYTLTGEVIDEVDGLIPTD